jgi:uncharacterized membrane protein
MEGMSTSHEQGVEPAHPGPAAVARTGTANLIYILYIVGFFVPLTTLAGVVMAYLNRGGGDEIADTHFTFQIRTFWIGFLAMVVGTVLSLVLVGYLVILLWLVWTLVRIISGMQKLGRGERVADPTAWGFMA